MLCDVRAALGKSLDYAAELKLMEGKTDVTTAHAEYLRKLPLGRQSLASRKFTGVYHVPDFSCYLVYRLHISVDCLWHPAGKDIKIKA